MTLRLITALAELSWEARLVSAFDRGEHGVTVARRTVDAVELLAVAAAGLADAALVSCALPHVDARTVADLKASGVAVVLAVPATQGGTTSVGEDGTVCEGASASEVSEALQAAVAAAAGRSLPSPRSGGSANGAGSTAATDTSAADVSLAPGTEVLASRGSGVTGERVGRRGGAGAGVAAAPDPSHPESLLLAVWGPTGAPGRTTVALALAETLASRGVATMIVDADSYGGAVAQSLGILDEGSGLLEACRDAASGRLDVVTLSNRSRVLGSGLRVLTGFARSDRWPEAAGPLVTRVLESCRSLSTVTVVDCGFCLEEDEALTYDTAAPQRNGATLAALRGADRVVAVCGPGPVAMQRLIRSFDQLRRVTDAPVFLVLNGVETERKAARDPLRVLERFAGLAPVARLPYDRATVMRSMAEGRSVVEVAPRSRLVAQFGWLAALVAGDVVPATPSGTKRLGFRGVRGRLRRGGPQDGGDAARRPNMRGWANTDGRTTTGKHENAPTGS